MISTGQSASNHDALQDHYDKLTLAFVWALGAHIAVAIGVAVTHGSSVGVAIGAGLALAGVPGGIVATSKGSHVSRLSVGVGLLGFSCLIVYLGNGSPFAYFHAFIALASLVFLADAAAVVAGAVVFGIFCVGGYVVAPEAVIEVPDVKKLLTLVGAVAFAAIIIGTLTGRYATYSAAFITSTSKLKLMASRVAGASSEISQSGTNLSDGATEQASLANAISEAIDELTSSTDNTKANLQKTNDLTNRSEQNAKEGYDRMSDMMSAVDEIETNADKISNIIKTIDEISFQTNILALNAAVEAARAGEAGAGFAVVADEVRGLAQRSAKAAGETESLIRVTVDSSKRGAGICKDVAHSIEQMRADIGEINSLVSQISAAGAEQFDGVTRVNGDVKRITEITQSNAAVAEESAAAAVQLKGLADDLNRLVNEIDRLNAAGQAGSASSLEIFSEESHDIPVDRSHNSPVMANSGDDAFADFDESSWRS